MYLVIASNLANYLVNSFKKIYMYNNIVMLPYSEAKIAIKSNLLMSIFSNFPGGAYPQTPLEGACYACWVCFAHSDYLRIEHPQLEVPSSSYAAYHKA